MDHREYALNVRDLTVHYQDNCALQSISVSVPIGSMLGIAGPNGGGKTSFLKAVLDVIPRKAGEVSLFGLPLNAQREKVAYIPQRLSVDWEFPVTVFDVVMMGRYVHMGWFSKIKSEDEDKVYEALEQVDLLHAAQTHISALSGGQQQRVFVARALAQNAELLLLDEPFVGIDMKTEKLIVSILQRLANQGRTVVVVHHDLQTLSDYFNLVFLLNVKKIGFGPIEKICMPEYICAAYGDRNIFATHQRI